MSSRIIFLIFIALSSIAEAQQFNEYFNVDNIMQKMPDSLTSSSQDIANYINSYFSSDTDKCRAAFIWIASNIEYDYENIFAKDNYQTTNEIIEKALKTRKGICMNFAELFNDIARRTGVKSYVVYGYTRQSGQVDRIPHAWCACLAGLSWLVYDPTWGSGFIQNSRFVRKLNNYYCKISPGLIIKTHMPFDPLWQFLYYPVTNQEFIEGKTQVNDKKRYFNFTDTLIITENQQPIEQLKSSIYRIEKNGVVNELITERIQYLKREIEYHYNKNNAENYNSAAALYNSGVRFMNDFINYRNKQFIPQKPDEEIKQMLDTAAHSFKLSRDIVKNIVKPEPNISSLVRQLNKSLDESTVSLNEQKAFLGKYIRTEKSLRKSLFYKQIRK